MKRCDKLLCVVLALILFCFSGCVERKESIDVNSSNRNYIVYDIGTLPSDLSRFEFNSNKSQNFEIALFQGLVSASSSGNSLNYVLAKKCDISKDGLVYTFTLRDDIRWSDGSSITSEDFYDFFKGILSLDNNSAYSGELSCINGVSEFISGKKDFSSVAITTKQKDALEIRLNYPCDYFLKLLSQPKYYLRKLDDNMRNWQKDYNNILFTGPFKITNVNENGNITLEKNDYYINKNEVNENKLILTTNKNGSEYSLADFETLNNIDVFFEPPEAEVDRLIESKEAKVVPSNSVEALFFNFNSKSAVSDVNFRKAINLAIDRDELSNSSIGVLGKELLSYIPKDINSQIKDNKFSSKSSGNDAYNCLKNSDYKSGEIIKIAYIDVENNKKVCEALVNMINKNISKYSGSNKNIVFQLNGYSPDEFSKVIKNNNYDICLDKYSLGYDDTMGFFELWNTTVYQNSYHYNNLNYNNLLYEINISKDENKKVDLYYKCEEELTKDLPMLPLYSKNIIVCYKKYINGISFNKFGNNEIWKLYNLQID